MKLSGILDESRVLVDADGSLVKSKLDALRVLAQQLGPVVSAEPALLERLLLEREQLQSTGIGDGVAVPHTSLDSAPGQAAGLVLCPLGVAFDAWDEKPVHIVLGVVGPRNATGEHLRVLARISRLLRDAGTRKALVESDTAEAVMALIRKHDQALQ